MLENACTQNSHQNKFGCTDFSNFNNQQKKQIVMITNPARNYRCKNEELPVIGQFLSSNLKRDLVDFRGYSPKFNEGYVVAFDGSIVALNELVNPQMETMELKATTSNLHTTMDKTVDATLRIAGYVKLAADKVPLTPADFGLTALRKKLHGRDAEGSLFGLQLVVANIKKFRAPLAAVGLTEELEAQLANALVSIAQDNQRQYEILTGRKALTQENLGAFNSFGAQVAEVCEIGKILFRNSNPERAKEYTFSYLLQKVRVVHKKNSGEEIVKSEE
jgi:hypothetical protein